MRSYSVKNFKNLKKALAVSVCSSMLFSGSPKTLGMENFSKIFNTENSSLRHLSYAGELSTATLEWVLGTLAVALLSYNIGVLKKSSDINKNIILSNELYCQLKDIMDVINSKKNISIVNINNNKKELIDNNNNNNLAKQKDVPEQLRDNKESGECSACIESIEDLLKEEKKHKIFKYTKQDNNSCCCSCLSCICRLLDVCLFCKARSEAEYVEKCKKDIITCTIDALEKFIELDNELRRSLNDKSKKLFAKLNKFIELAKKTEVPQIQLDNAFKCMRDFLKEENIIDNDDITFLDSRIKSRKLNCCQKFCVCCYKCCEKSQNEGIK